MMRTGTVIYLALAILAAPMACPCSVERVLASLATPPSPALGAAALTSCRCCPRSPSCTGREQGQAIPPTPTPCPCPYHECGDDTVLSDRGSRGRSVDDGQDGARLSKMQPLARCPFGIPQRATAAPDFCLRSFHNPKEFLSAFHFLRC